MRQSAKYQVIIIIIILESLIISSTSTISIREQLRTSILRNISQTSASREKRRTASYRNSTEDSWSRWIYFRRYILIVKTLPFPYIKFIHYRHEKAFDSVVGWEAFLPAPVNVWNGSCCVCLQWFYTSNMSNGFICQFLPSTGRDSHISSSHITTYLQTFTAGWQNVIALHCSDETKCFRLKTRITTPRIQRSDRDTRGENTKLTEAMIEWTEEIMR